MRTRRIIPAISCLAGLALVFASGRAQAELLDQSFDALAAGQADIVVFGATVGGPNNQQLAQTFTVGLSGLLTSVEVQISGFTTSQPILAPITVDIRQTPGGSNLATAVIPIADIPTNFDFVSVDVSAFTVGVSAGDELAIVLSSNNTNSNVSWIVATTEDSSLLSNLYPFGTAFFARTDTGGVFVDSRVGALEGVDHGFRTFVGPTAAVPEPSALTLWSLGAVAFVGLGYRRRKRAA